MKNKASGEEQAVLMGGLAPPSDSSAYISIPVTEEHNGNPKPSNPTLADLDDGPLVLPPFSFATQQSDSRQDPKNRFPRSKLVLLLGLLVLVVVVVTPVSLMLRSRFAAQAEANRLYEIRAFKQRTAFHFQPDKNWMNGKSNRFCSCVYLQSIYCLSLTINVLVCVCAPNQSTELLCFLRPIYSCVCVQSLSLTSGCAIRLLLVLMV